MGRFKEMMIDMVQDLADIIEDLGDDYELLDTYMYDIGVSVDIREQALKLNRIADKLEGTYDTGNNDSRTEDGSHPLPPDTDWPASGGAGNIHGPGTGHLFDNSELGTIRRFDTGSL